MLYVGQYRDVLGEEEYAARLMPAIERLGGQWKFLGVLPDEEVVAFFTICDVTVLPSLNSTESFGMVQIRSMSCGTPVVAADIPGVRQPVLQTGFGRIVPPGDAHALAAAVVAILGSPGTTRGMVSNSAASMPRMCRLPATNRSFSAWYRKPSENQST